MSTLSKKKLAKKDLFKIKIRYNKDIKRKGIRKMNKHIEKAKILNLHELIECNIYIK